MTMWLPNEVFLAKKLRLKIFFCVAVNPLVPIFWDLPLRGGRKQ